MTFAIFKRGQGLIISLHLRAVHVSEISDHVSVHAFKVPQLCKGIKVTCPLMGLRDWMKDHNFLNLLLVRGF